MIRSASWTLAATALLSGCAITQNVKPVGALEAREVCVVVNAAVSQPAFLTTYVRVLNEKGYTVRQLQAGSPVTECEVTSTYTANWRWDLALYMAYAEIKVFNKGQPAGEAIYDSTRGGANMNKFVNGENKIAELVNQLFPGRASVKS